MFAHAFVKNVLVYIGVLFAVLLCSHGGGDHGDLHCDDHGHVDGDGTSAFLFCVLFIIF